jgi:hypothetical protein
MAVRKLPNSWQYDFQIQDYGRQRKAGFDLPPKFRTTQNVTDCLFGTVRRVHEEESI